MAIDISKRFPSKNIPKTPYELLIGHKPSLRHLLIWRSLTEATLCNPYEPKLDPRTISCYFLYPSSRKVLE